VDRFIITRGNATGLIANCIGWGNDPDGCGGGIFVYQGSPLISNNLITNNVATDTLAGYPNGETGYGGGIYVRGSNGTIITGNTISDNSGSLVASGAGGGVCIVSSGAGTQILRNQILNNVCTSTASVGWGGGMYLTYSDAIVQDNLIQGNVASTEGSSQGSGILQWFGAPTIRGNRITENNRGEAVYLGFSRAQFEGNLVLKNDTNIGVYLIYGDGAGPTLANNIIAENEINNFTAASSSDYPITASFINNTLVGKGTNSDSAGVYVGVNSTVIMKNTIIANHAVGIALQDPPGVVTPDHTLFWNNGIDGIRGTDPVDGDPAFKDPDNGNYHIGPASAAINAGADAGATTDIDGQARDPFPDIGADEYVSLPDLIGEWTSMTQTCKYGKKGPQCKIQGTLDIQNIGSTNAPSCLVKFYLSDDGYYNEVMDTYLKGLSTGTVKAGAKKVKKLSYSFTAGQTAKRKYIIAVIDANNTVVEPGKTNNIVVFGPLP
jgi:hypothetical protein